MPIFRILSLFALLVTAAVWSDIARAEKRLALVIGNDLYNNLTANDQLKKARNDARAMAAAFRNLGFDVMLGENLNRRDFNLKLQQLAAKIQPGDHVAVFFAGHGVRVGSANYLLPSDVPQIASGQEGLLESEAVDAERISETLRKRGARISLLILDACRNNPFADAKGRSIGGARGLARMDPPEGTFVMYSAGAGQQALDRLSDKDANPNSVFTRTLLPLLKTPGLEINVMAREVKRRVRDLARTVGGHRQTPAIYNEVIGNYYLNRGAGQQVKPKLPPPPPVTLLTPGDKKTPPAGKPRDGRLAYLKAVSVHTLEAYEKFLADFPDHPKADAVRDIVAAMSDERFWNRARKSDTLSSYRLYLRAFPKGANVAEANKRIVALIGPQKPNVLPPVKPVPPKQVIPQKGKCGHPHGRYLVAGLAAGASLKIRQGPGSGYRSVATLVVNANGIGVGKCLATRSGGQWCRVRYQCVSGFAPARFLMDAQTRQRAGTSRNSRGQRGR
jgi:hypothetical protein